MNGNPPLLDDLQLYELKEDPDRWESLVRNEQQRAAGDPLAAAILESVYWEADRESAFQRYLASRDFAATLRLLNCWKVRPDDPIVEVGAGSGFLAWALLQSGFRDVSLLEPNPHFITGTGYLRSRPDAAQLKIANSLDEWYSGPGGYRHIITRNCVHHFPNFTWVAACLRGKLQADGNWFMIREPFAESASEWFRFMQGHPYSQKYGVFEFACPARQYVSAVELAGFRLRGVVPAGYANNCLALHSETPGSRWNRWSSAVQESVQRHLAGLSVAAWEVENRLPRFLRNRIGRFSRPQVLWFRKTAMGPLPPHTIWYPHR